ncbi:adenylate/guanylate cyclase domain-containing protein [Neptunicella sp. SCSIO 80796]|uniref:adenylate/guanylate cyclase domain-containing protein n=1 Tax=Neptunicella plasticusilytica TaxID=3117012 RepID=UPI003A4E4AE4
MIESIASPTLTASLLFVVIVFGIIMLWMTQRLRNLAKLYRVLRKQTHLSLTEDDTSEFAQQQLVLQLHNQLAEAKHISETFRKFVPNQFFEHLAKDGLESIELGKADEDEVAILFCDIRGFTSLSEKMSPQELMNFLNSYFLRMNAPIHENGGFIDKFIGDAIMAIFDHPEGNNADKARDALKAASDMRTALDLYNEHRANCNYPPVNNGIGIHFGPVIMGTVGSEDRMDSTVIGDSVNTAFRLESLAPKFNADIIVTAQTLDISGMRETYPHRVLDWVRVKGKQQPIEVYEILEHLPEEEKKRKLSTAKLVEQGLALRIQQNWDQAINCFQQALQIQPEDKLVSYHLEHCYRMRSNQMPADWDGALNI